MGDDRPSPLGWRSYGITCAQLLAAGRFPFTDHNICNKPIQSVTPYVTAVTSQYAVPYNKKVRSMIDPDLYELMDWLSYGAEQKARGKVKALLELVRSGDITIETAARHLGVTPDYFVRRHMDSNEA